MKCGLNKKILGNKYAEGGVLFSPFRISQFKLDEYIVYVYCDEEDKTGNGSLRGKRHCYWT